MVVIALLAVGVKSLFATSCFMLLYQNIYLRSLYNLFLPGCIECGVLCSSSNIFFLSSSTTGTHIRLWNLIVLSLIRSSCGLLACAMQISSIRVGYTSMVCNTDLVLGVTILSSNFWNSLHRSTASSIRQFSTGDAWRLNASATTFAFFGWYWKFIS